MRTSNGEVRNDASTRLAEQVSWARSSKRITAGVGGTARPEGNRAAPVHRPRLLLPHQRPKRLLVAPLVDTSPALARHRQRIRSHGGPTDPGGPRPPAQKAERNNTARPPACRRREGALPRPSTRPAFRPRPRLAFSTGLLCHITPRDSGTSPNILLLNLLSTAPYGPVISAGGTRVLPVMSPPRLLISAWRHRPRPICDNTAEILVGLDPR
jgi:hypothetical protein